MRRAFFFRNAVFAARNDDLSGTLKSYDSEETERDYQFFFAAFTELTSDAGGNVFGNRIGGAAAIAVKAFFKDFNAEANGIYYFNCCSLIGKCLCF